MERNLISVLEENTELKLKLLAIMRDENTWMIGDELAEKLEVPTKRVHTLISSLLQDLIDFNSDAIQLTTLKGRGSYLQIDDPEQYVKLRQSIIENSIIFQIILAIAINKEVTLGQLSMNNFVSESSIRNRIKAANELTKSIGVKIVSRKNHYQFQGEEAQIRVMLNTIFWRLYRGAEWPFRNVNQKHLFKLLANLSDAIDLPIKSLTLYQVGYLFAINYSRARQGHEITIKKNWQPYLFLCEQVDQVTNIYQLFLDNYGLSKSETDFFLLEVLSRSKIYTHSDKRKILNLVNLRNTPAYTACEQLLKKYEEKFGMLSKTEEQLFFEYTYPCHIYAELFSNIVYASSGYRMYRQTGYYFPILKSKMKEILFELYEKTELKLFLNEQYLMDKYILIFSFFKPAVCFEKEFIIYVETDLSEMMEQKLINQIEANFKTFFNIKIYTTLNKLKKDRKKFDIIISTSVSPTFRVFTDQAQYFLVHPILTRRDIRMISDYLHMSLTDKMND
ncbi:MULTISPECIES: helix-turn-helix domain-containing protein [unclassified Enterococcus]|uniref:helix-turn-helix domain-containing protein n=1 Tax=unclassified Enterococcus TaxID=2608891 RepID=UPI001CE06427|nr:MULTISPECIES: helix-turn-helix domain-containing protein [unclassified Enterococcus]MCA5012176.1 helix-turn-helix domain-containing protein [Enterococcus sp. S23]MCA5015427.1 helix-turn-helix domain-containing protein [Enterococcus sp. S22(2020)]